VTLGLLLSFVWFSDGPNRPPTLCTKFEVDTFSHCINIKENPQIFGSSPSLGPSPFFLGGILWWALANPTSLPILKSQSSVVAKILKGHPQIWEAPLAQTTPTFPLGEILWWDLAKPSCVPNLNSLSSAVAKILKGDPKLLGGPLSQDHDHFSSGCNFIMGHSKPKLHTKFAVASFNRCRNIKAEPQNFRELP